MASEEPAAPAKRPGIDKKRAIILGIIELAVLALIAFRVLPQVGSYSDAWAALQAMAASSLVIVAVAVVIYLAWYGLPFVAAAPGLGFWRAQQLNQAAFAISNGVPGGGAFGLGVQYAMFASYGYPAAAATAAIAAIGVWSLFVTLGLPVFGVLALISSGRAAESYTTGAVIAVGVIVLMVVVFALIMRSEELARRIGGWLDALVAKLPAKLRRGKDIVLTPSILNFRESISGLVRRRWHVITGAQVGVALTQFAILYLALRGLEGWDSPTGTPLLLVFGAFAISQLGLLIPVTPGGLGTVDAAMVTLLVGLGTEPGIATASALVWRAASFIPQIIVGVLCLVLWTKDANRLAQGQVKAVSPPTAA